MGTGLYNGIIRMPSCIGSELRCDSIYTNRISYFSRPFPAACIFTYDRYLPSRFGSLLLSAHKRRSTRGRLRPWKEYLLGMNQRTS